MKRLCAIVFAGAMACLAPAIALAAPAAGSVIGNQATATYNDAGGNSRTATSNLVQTTVTQVKSFTLTANGARTAAPGQTVYYPHTLINTGNGTDSYALNAPTSTSFGAAGPHASLAYYLDANGDGVPDNAAAINTSGPIAAGGTFRFVVGGTVPAAAASGSSAGISVSATDTTPTTATNTDTTSIANSVIGVTKALSSNSGTSPSGPITVTLSYSNSGTAAANNVQLTDALPASMTYVAGSGRWSVSGPATALTDANDGVEQAGGFPPGINYRSTLGAGAAITAIIASVPSGVSGTVSFQVNVNANLAPQTINNTAQYQTDSQLATNSNTASYQVLQGAAVVANGSSTLSANGTGEPVTIASAAAGTTLSFNNYVWNRGNGSDTFDITVISSNFPAGTTVSLMQQDGATTLINSGGAAAPDTGPIPGVGQACPAPFVTDATTTPATCGYRVVARVNLPANAANGVYSIVKRATSVFNNTVFDDVTDTLSAVAANTVDVTNDRAAPPAGAAVAADGLGPTASSIVRTSTVTPGGAPVATRLRVWIANTGSVADSFALTAVFAATSAASVTPPALPAGWSVALLADASGALADCSTVGAPLASTGALAAGAARLVCAQVTVPALASGTASAGNYDFDFTATSSTNAAVADVIRDRVAVATVRSMTLAPDGAQQTFPNGSVVYVHSLANLGNATDTATFAAGCLADSRVPQGWTSTAFVDANANGTLEIGTDAAITCGVSSVTLNAGASRAVFVRVSAPATATAADPANVTTLTATYSGPITATDTTSVTTGLMLVKEQQALGTAGCANNNAPGASYSQAAIAASAATVPGACIAYRLTATNTSAAPITGIVVNDPVPANTRMHYACSGNGVSSPSVSAGVIAASTPADGAAGTVSANVGTLAAGQSAVVYFCARIDAVGPPPGAVISNQAGASGTQSGNSTSVNSNATSATVGSPVGATFAGLLASSTRVTAAPGATLLLRHTLTNTGTAIDSFSLTAADQNAGWSFTSVTLFPDANGDGQPDGAVPLANPIVLAPGVRAQFVLRLVVPAGGFASNENRVRIDATSTGGAAVAGLIDTVALLDTTPRDCAAAGKSFSRLLGPSPYPLVTVTINYTPCDRARAKLVVADRLPAGMRYIAGSARWSVTGPTALTDGVSGTDREGAGSHQIAYDYNVSAPGTVTATIFNLAANTSGAFTFNVEVEGGLAVGTAVINTAEYNFFSAAGAYETRQFTSATYTVDGSIDLRLAGDRVASAVPGTTVAFTNVLTNLGTLRDTFDVTLAASTFPPGAVIALFRSDGVTPLADTDGNGTPDTGPVAPGASYNIVVKVTLPETTPPASYRVAKTARSATAPARFVTVDDVIDTVAPRCVLVLDPDNQALIGRGQHVTYTHFLTNRGNCQETVRAMLDYIGDSRPGWTSAAYVDNRTAGAGSLPGVVDATDTQIVRGWSTVLAPGQALRVLVDVFAPGAQPKAAGAKQVTESNVTTLVITGTTVGALVVRDTTLLDSEDVSQQPDNVIRNFTDATYASPTLWGAIGRELFLRADAAACNADRAAVESRTVVLTGANGEREELTAVETGPDTGIFVAAPLAVRAPPVVRGDRIVEGRANDTFDLEVLGCGRRIAGIVTLMEPASVVFDSRTNDPIAGATVTLVPAAGGQCSASPATMAANANPVTTASDGRFAFAAATGEYCVVVKAPNGYRFASQVPYPRLPHGRNLDVAGLTRGGSYGTPFRVPADGLVVVDIPVDAVAQDGLFIQKAASRAIAEIGDFIDYTVRINNATGNALDRAVVVLADDLPAGFAYVAGSARRERAPIADPAGGAGPRLSLALGSLARGEQVAVTYRVRVGPGAMQGDGVNRVQARYAFGGTTTVSNVATAKVRVAGGVFGDKGFILGKIFMDCNANGVQDAGERGVPGVRLLLEDGTYVVTDGGGKFSFYGVSNRTHVVKADRTTLPSGARLAAISARHLGDGGSRIVDLKSGEMHRADFAIAGCDAEVVTQVESRAAALAKRDELAALAGSQLATEARVIADPRTLPATGVVDAAGAPTAAAAALPATQPIASAHHSPRAGAPKAGEAQPATSPAAPLVDLEKLLPDLDDKLAFVGLSDGDTLALAQTPIRVKGSAGAEFELSVNGKPVPVSRVGKRAVMRERQVQAWEFFGVDLEPGDNALVVVQRDGFGNERGRASIRVVAPGKPARIAIEVPAEGGIADGRSTVKVVVKLLDARGVPVGGRVPVTLEATRGAWDVKDFDPVESGTQVMIENGRGEFALLSPVEPGEGRVIALGAGLRADARLDFLPELRSMIAAGVVEGVINVRRLDTRSLVPARAQDGFEQELRHLSRTSGDGRRDAGARAAFFLKGKVRGEFLLTAAYDSDKDTRERLFRDIQPDEFYPVYGDSAVRGYDAQSTARLYVRIDHRKSYLLYGDFTTQGDANVLKLSGYSRSLTGVKEHYDDGRVVANVFASRDSTRQTIDEIRANGTSGPYLLSSASGLVNSEKVEILTRDRSRPALVLQSVPQARFFDYEMEPLTGRLLFKSPVPSVDANLNPISIRVTYEVDQGGPQFWVFGGDARVKVTDRIEVGATYAEDRNPAAPFKLIGANGTVRLGERTTVSVEFARTDRPDTVGQGDAARIHVRHDGENLKAEAFAARTDAAFDNPGAYLAQGRGESGARASFKIDERTTVKAEALRTEDTVTRNVRDGYAASVERSFDHRLKLEIGLRHARETGGPAIPASNFTPGSAGTTPNDVTSVRARVTGPVPGVAGATIYGEVEVDTQDVDRKVLAVGGDYALPNRGKLYFRHEFISSLTGPYGLNNEQRQNTTVFGMDTEYMKDARLFSEYRIRDAISGGDSEVAIGLKNLWPLAEGLRVGTSIERVQAISGAGQNENTALALAVEYTANPLWKGSTRLELRDSTAQQSLLHTLGVASKLNRDWTFLVRNAISVQRNKGGERDGGERLLERFQAGVAYRDSETNRWNALARVEHREERDDTQAGIDLRRSVNLVSINADFQPRRPFLVTGRYAAKWATENSRGVTSKYRAQLASGRFTWEFAPRWDFAVAASGLFGERSRSRQYAFGAEVGYLLATNLWISAGYNVLGYHDEDLAAGEYTNKGAYLRLRYKFDEAVMGSAGEGTR